MRSFSDDSTPRRASLALTCLLVLALTRCGTSPGPDAGIPGDVLADVSQAADGDATPGDVTPADATPGDAASGPEAGLPLGPGYAPPLLSQGGPVLSSPHIVTITFANDPNRDAYEAYGAAMAADTAWWTAAAGEYGIGPVSVLGNYRIDTPAPATMSEADVRQLLLARTGPGQLPRNPDGSFEGIVYMVYLPAGTRATLYGAVACGQGWHGTHDVAARVTGGLVYVETATCPGLRGFDDVGYAEVAASHELLEAVTDPYPNMTPAYYSDGDASEPWTLYSELTDRCAGQYLRRPGYPLARNWSNAAAVAGREPCVPVPDGAVQYGVWTPVRNLQIAAGGTLDVPITGFARGAVSDFRLRAYTPSGTDFMPTLDAAMLNDGVTTTLHLTAPAGAAVGAHGYVDVIAGPDNGDYRNYPLHVTVR